jgi:malonyl-CoA O-methyltransferase
MNDVNAITCSPYEYAEASILAKEAGEEMLSRLDWMTIKPKVIVDMGYGIGRMSVALQAKYQEADVLALDISETMIQHAKHHEGGLATRKKELAFVCADAGKLPLPNQVVDLIFANLLLPLYPDVIQLIREWRRVLRPEGVLMFTALGPDTLQEVTNVFAASDLPILADMHDIGDLLLKEKFVDPVLDVNHYTLVYHDKEKLITELYQSGIVTRSSSSLNLNALLPADDKTWPITYEIVYSHAFVPAETEEISASDDGVVRIPLSHLRKKGVTKE